MPINRNLLHKKLTDEFKVWLADNGYMLDTPKSIYEAVRVASSHPGMKPLIYYLRDRSDHLTITTQEELSVARSFIRERKRKLALALSQPSSKERTENQ